MLRLFSFLFVVRLSLAADSSAFKFFPGGRDRFPIFPHDTAPNWLNIQSDVPDLQKLTKNAPILENIAGVLGAAITTVQSWVGKLNQTATSYLNVKAMCICKLTNNTGFTGGHKSTTRSECEDPNHQNPVCSPAGEGTWLPSDIVGKSCIDKLHLEEADCFKLNGRLNTTCANLFAWTNRLTVKFCRWIQKKISWPLKLVRKLDFVDEWINCTGQASESTCTLGKMFDKAQKYVGVIQNIKDVIKKIIDYINQYTDGYHLGAFGEVRTALHSCVPWQDHELAFPNHVELPENAEDFSIGAKFRSFVVSEKNPVHLQFGGFEARIFGKSVPLAPSLSLGFTLDTFRMLDKDCPFGFGCGDNSKGKFSAANVLGGVKELVFTGTKQCFPINWDSSYLGQNAQPFESPFTGNNLYHDFNLSPWKREGVPVHSILTAGVNLDWDFSKRLDVPAAPDPPLQIFPSFVTARIWIQLDFGFGWHTIANTLRDQIRQALNKQLPTHSEAVPITAFERNHETLQAPDVTNDRGNFIKLGLSAGLDVNVGIDIGVVTIGVEFGLSFFVKARPAADGGVLDMNAALVEHLDKIDAGAYTDSDCEPIQRIRRTYACETKRTKQCDPSRKTDSVCGGLCRIPYAEDKADRETHVGHWKECYMKYRKLESNNKVAKICPPSILQDRNRWPSEIPDLWRETRSVGVSTCPDIDLKSQIDAGTCKVVGLGDPDFAHLNEGALIKCSGKYSDQATMCHQRCLLDGTVSVNEELEEEPCGARTDQDCYNLPLSRRWLSGYIFEADGCVVNSTETETVGWSGRGCHPLDVGFTSAVSCLEQSDCAESNEEVCFGADKSQRRFGFCGKWPAARPDRCPTHILDDAFKDFEDAIDEFDWKDPSIEFEPSLVKPLWKKPHRIRTQAEVDKCGITKISGLCGTASTPTSGRTCKNGANAKTCDPTLTRTIGGVLNADAVEACSKDSRILICDSGVCVPIVSVYSEEIYNGMLTREAPSHLIATYSNIGMKLDAGTQLDIEIKAKIDWKFIKKEFVVYSWSDVFRPKGFPKYYYKLKKAVEHLYQNDTTLYNNNSNATADLLNKCLDPDPLKGASAFKSEEVPSLNDGPPTNSSDMVDTILDTHDFSLDVLLAGWRASQMCAHGQPVHERLLGQLPQPTRVTMDGSTTLTGASAPGDFRCRIIRASGLPYTPLNSIANAPVSGSFQCKHLDIELPRFFGCFSDSNSWVRGLCRYKPKRFLWVIRRYPNPPDEHCKNGELDPNSIVQNSELGFASSNFRAWFTYYPHKDVFINELRKCITEKGNALNAAMRRNTSDPPKPRIELIQVHTPPAVEPCCGDGVVSVFEECDPSATKISRVKLTESKFTKTKTNYWPQGFKYVPTEGKGFYFRRNGIVIQRPKPGECLEKVPCDHKHPPPTSKIPCLVKQSCSPQKLPENVGLSPKLPENQKLPDQKLPGNVNQKLPGNPGFSGRRLGLPTQCFTETECDSGKCSSTCELLCEGAGSTKRCTPADRSLDFDWNASMADITAGRHCTCETISTNLWDQYDCFENRLRECEGSWECGNCLPSLLNSDPFTPGICENKAVWSSRGARHAYNELIKCVGLGPEPESAPPLEPEVPWPWPPRPEDDVSTTIKPKTTQALPKTSSTSFDCTRKVHGVRTCYCPAGYHGTATLISNTAFNGCYPNPTRLEDWIVKVRQDVDNNGVPFATTKNAVAYDDITKKVTVKFEKSGGRTHELRLFKGDCTSPMPENGLLKIAPTNGRLAGVNTKNTKNEFLDVIIDVDLAKIENSVLFQKATSEANFCVRVDLKDDDIGVNFVETKVILQVRMVGSIQDVSVQLKRAKVETLLPATVNHVIKLDACQCDAASDLDPNARCTKRTSSDITVAKTLPPLTQSDILSLCISTQTNVVEIEKIEKLQLTQASSGITFSMIADSRVNSLTSYNGADQEKGHIQRVKTRIPSLFFTSVNPRETIVTGTTTVVAKTGRRLLINIVIEHSFSEGIFSMIVELRANDGRNRVHSENETVHANDALSLVVSISLVAVAGLALTTGSK